MFGLEEAESGSVRVNWLGQSEVSAKDLLATPQDHEHADARSEAVEFLERGSCRWSRPGCPSERGGRRRRYFGAHTGAGKERGWELLATGRARPASAGRGQWLWKLPVVDLVDDDIKDATTPIKDAKGCQNNRRWHP